MDNVYNWQFNCLPGSANQGAILMTRNDILRPPFTQDDFIWVAMEDVIGTADIRLTYNEKTNLYTLEKAIGHRNNDGSWIRDWYVVGSWERLSQEVVEILRQLVYVEYRFDTSIPNVLKVVGVKKDLTEVVLCDISFVSLEEFQQALITLDNKITDETTRATQREDKIVEYIEEEIVRAVTREFELTQMIEAATMNPGRAIEVTADKAINVLIDNDSIKINNSNQLKADVFDDTAIVNDKGWSSAKISQQLTSAIHYKGQVADPQHLPSSTAAVGDMYNVISTGDNYVWNGTTWDNMSGEYIAGAGINITGKVISASGIAFGTGNGIIVNPSTGELETNIDNNTIKFDQQDGSMYVNKQAVNPNLLAGEPITITDEGTSKRIGLNYDANQFNLGNDDQLTLKLSSNEFSVGFNGLQIRISNGIGISSNGLVVLCGDGLRIDNDGNVETILKTWTGTQAQYDAISEKDPNTIYMIHD